MTGKADFTTDEWKLLREAPTSAGMLVMEADRGGVIRESFSMAKAYADARNEHGSSQFLRSSLTQHIRDAIGLLEEKAAAEEVEEYRRFVMAVANRVADAHREGFMGMSGERVSDAERKALADIAEAAGSTSG
jgi:hypothetical protein